MASRVGLNYQALGGWKIKHGLTKCYTVPDILPVHAWCSSVRAWYFICPCLIFLSVHAWCLSITCLIFLSVHAWCLSVRAWCFICTCLMFYLYVFDVLSVRAWYLSVRAWYLSVRAWWFYLYVLDGFIRPCLTFLSVRALCFYPSVLDIFVRLCLMFLSNCVWFNPTILDKISLSKISFFVSTGVIFCQSRFLSLA